MPSKKWLIGCAAIGLATLVGCNDAPELHTVSGRVTIDGEPVTNGAVRFMPAAGRVAGGPLDEDGRFQMTTYENGDGVAAGEHLVAVYAAEPLGETEIRWHAPKRYSRPTTSGITVTVDKPIEDLQIELTWGDTKGPYVERG